jgi:hypothetical protein
MQRAKLKGDRLLAYLLDLSLKEIERFRDRRHIVKIRDACDASIRRRQAWRERAREAILSDDAELKVDMVIEYEQIERMD